jgi:hypothetical protein
MTTWERDHAEQLDASRRRRIAAGAGVGIVEVSQFIRQFEMTRQMMRATGSFPSRMKLGAVLGLVTNDPLHRDPSYVSPISDGEAWRRGQVTIAIALGTLIVLAYTAFRHG